jgi:predicted O-methyltransferase YrrM
MITGYDLAEKGMMSREEIHLLKACVMQLPQEPVVANIGAGEGTSALAILEERNEAVIFSFDIHPVVGEKQAIAAAGLDSSRVIRVLGKSWESGRHFPIHFDLVLVDGAHDDAAVAKDIEAFLPLVKPGGYIIFHDYVHKNVPGLTKIVDREMEGYERVGGVRYLVAFKV